MAQLSSANKGEAKQSNHENGPHFSTHFLNFECIFRPSDSVDQSLEEISKVMTA